MVFQNFRARNETNQGADRDIHAIIEFKQYFPVTLVRAAIFGISGDRRLACIERPDRPIKSFAMNDLKLRGIDAPLIRCNLQSIKDGR